MIEFFKFQLKVLSYRKNHSKSLVYDSNKIFWVCVKMEAFNLLVQFVINDTSRVFKVDYIV